MKSLESAVQDLARKTITWQLRWLLGLFQDHPGMIGGIPWFQGYGSGMLKPLPPWDTETSSWPDVDKCNLNVYEQKMAQFCWDRLSDLMMTWIHEIPRGEQRE